MSIAEFVSRKFDIPLENVMLLRHSNATIDLLLKHGGTIEEYTAVQPIGGKFDYTCPGKEPIQLLVVIVRDKVFGVYKVLGVEKQGTTFSMTSTAHQNFDRARDKPDRPGKRFKLDRLTTVLDGRAIRGWEGPLTRTSVQRANGKFFLDISVPGVDVTESTDFPEARDLERELERKVREALRGTADALQKRLATSDPTPRRIRVTTTIFDRNPDVIAAALVRADGVCESCGSSAPFARKKDGTPYLEVHHKVRLADGGKDTLANALALCPNCHRREHYA